MIYSTGGQFLGYAFIEFENESDLRKAYIEADYMKIHNRRIVVDVERGRTVKGWLPRRLGGGLGKTRAGGDNVNQKYSGRENVKSSLHPSSAPSLGSSSNDHHHDDNRDGRNQSSHHENQHRSSHYQYSSSSIGNSLNSKQGNYYHSSSSLPHHHHHSNDRFQTRRH